MYADGVVELGHFEGAWDALEGVGNGLEAYLSLALSYAHAERRGLIPLVVRHRLK